MNESNEYEQRNEHFSSARGTKIVKYAGRQPFAGELFDYSGGVERVYPERKPVCSIFWVTLCNNCR